MTSGALRKLLIAGAAVTMLAACAGQHLTPAQGLENADTASSLAYSAVAEAANAYEAAKPSDAARAEALKVKAWGLLQQERALYAQGQSVAALVTELQIIEAQAKGL